MTTTSTESKREYSIRFNNTEIPIKLTKSGNRTTLKTTLPSGNVVTAQFIFTTGTIERKAHVLLYTTQHGIRETVFNRCVKVKNNKVLPLTLTRKNKKVEGEDYLWVKINVPAALLTLSVGGVKLTARSTCKPPDIYRKRDAMRQAVNNLYKDKEIKKHFSGTDYQAFLRVCMSRPRKNNQTQE